MSCALPINRIIGLHQLILEDLCENPEEERDFLRQAHQAIFEVLQNLDLLIQVSKFDIGAVEPKQEPVLVDGVFAKVRELMEMKCLNRQCRLEIVAPPPALLVEADNHWLQQLLLLLLDGALVAGGQRLSLAAQTVNGSTVDIKLTTDVAVEQWSEPAAPTDASDPDAVDISPGFRYQLARRMAQHLKGTLKLPKYPRNRLRAVPNPSRSCFLRSTLVGAGGFHRSRYLNSGFLMPSSCLVFTDRGGQIGGSLSDQRQQKKRQE